MDAFDCCFPLCQVAVNSETSGAIAIKERGAHTQTRVRKRGAVQFICYHWLCVPEAPKGNHETRGRLHLPPPRQPSAPASLALPLLSTHHPSTPQTFLIISSPKYCGSVTKELTLMHVLINPQTLETRLTKILRKG